MTIFMAYLSPVGNLTFDRSMGGQDLEPKGETVASRQAPPYQYRGHHLSGPQSGEDSLNGEPLHQLLSTTGATQSNRDSIHLLNIQRGCAAVRTPLVDKRLNGDLICF